MTLNLSWAALLGQLFVFPIWLLAVRFFGVGVDEFEIFLRFSISEALAMTIAFILVLSLKIKAARPK